MQRRGQTYLLKGGLVGGLERGPKEQTRISVLEGEEPLVSLALENGRSKRQCRTHFKIG